MSAYFVLLADTSVSVGDVIPNVDDDGRPYAAWLDPRNIEISYMLDGRADDCLVDIVRAGEESPIRVARVSPRGTVRPHAEFYDYDAEVDDRNALEADGGWTVEAFEPLTIVLGPQAEQVLAAVTEGIRVMEDGGDDVLEETYIAVSNAQHDSPGTTALHRAANAAEGALHHRGADGYWWANCIGCAWGSEILALAARDLIGSTPEWTREAYDVLTLPWRSTFPGPLHADDNLAARS